MKERKEERKKTQAGVRGGLHPRFLLRRALKAIRAQWTEK